MKTSLNEAKGKVCRVQALAATKGSVVVEIENGYSDMVTMQSVVRLDGTWVGSVGVHAPGLRTTGALDAITFERALAFGDLLRMAGSLGMVMERLAYDLPDGWSIDQAHDVEITVFESIKRMEAVEWVETEEPASCDMCGEIMKPTDERGEFAVPSRGPGEPDISSAIGHAECGLARGYEIA